jgi:hypothetical protein
MPASEETDAAEDRMAGEDLTIVTTEGPSGRRDRGDAVRRVVESTVSADRLHESLARFLETLGEILAAGPTRAGDFELDEIGFSAEIGANGEFKLLGTGVGVTGSSAVTFSWRRRRDDDPAAPPPAAGAGG